MTALTIATLALRITLVLGAVGIVNAARRRSSAGSRHWLWMLALVGVSVLPLGARITPPLRVIPWKSAEAPVRQPDPRNATLSDNHLLPAPSHQLPAAGFKPLMAGGASLGNVTPAVAPTTNISSIIAAIWILGTLLLAARLLRAHNAARRVVKNSYLTRQPNIGGVPVRFSAEVDLPFTYGLRDPVIILPAEADAWSASQLHATLMHEAAHAARRDGIALLVSQLIVAVYWWHPIVWVAARAAAADRERACDDAVLREGMRASEYGQCLLAHADAISAWKSSPLAIMMFGHSAGLGPRVAALLDPAIDRSSGARPKLAVIAGVLGLVMIVGAAAPTELKKPVVVHTNATPANHVRPASALQTGTVLPLVSASIVPVASIASAEIADATVCRQAKDWHKARTYRDASVHITGAGGSFKDGVAREIWTGIDCIAWLQYSGQVEASADERNMVVAGDGRFIAHNEGPDGVREYSETAGSSSLRLDGRNVQIGAAEQEWIAAMTREYLRRTGKNAQNRARRALTSGGIPALLAEAGGVPRTDVRAQYLVEGYASTRNAREVTEFIHAGSALLDSLDSRAPFLTAVPAAYRSNPVVLEAIYSEASAIEPDGALEEVLAKTDPPRPLPASLRPWMEKIIASIQTSERRMALSAYYLGTRP